ncbi:6601_t:CDS:2 [Scutellospora calospora]|uniref:6601_t:CDS:1 n=1 Tax=Scutellospora calospora TaxID=85575 RepID=A0ACA9KL42_9GLOM|nr:6601_t:CDS:2 [Scutellospora calospora]
MSGLPLIIKIIGQGGFAVVYSAIFQGKEYALKSLNNNITLDNKAFKQIRNEIKSLYNCNVVHSNIIKLYGFTRDPSTDNFILAILRNEREKIIFGTPSDYASLYEKCWSSDTDKRPVLNEILTTLGRLSNLPDKFIINNIDVDDQQLKHFSEDYASYDDTNESLKLNNYLKDDQGKINTTMETDNERLSPSQDSQKDLQLNSPSVEFITNSIGVDDQQYKQLSEYSVSSDIDQKVDEFVSKIDLAVLCSSDNGYMSVYVKGSRIKNPISKYFQFKSAVFKYASKHKISGFNDRTILSKAQSKLWIMLSEERKEIFKKLYEKALKFYKKKLPNYEFHYLRYNPILKIKSMDAGRSKRKKNPTEKPDQNMFDSWVRPQTVVVNPNAYRMPNSGVDQLFLEAYRHYFPSKPQISNSSNNNENNAFLVDSNERNHVLTIPMKEINQFLGPN